MCYIFGFREGDIKKFSAPGMIFMNTLVTSIRHNCTWKHTEMRNVCNKAATSFFFLKRIFCCEKQWNVSHSGSNFSCEKFCFSGNINSRNGCALSIIFFYQTECWSRRLPRWLSVPCPRCTPHVPLRAMHPLPLIMLLSFLALCCVHTLPLPSSKEMNGSMPLQPQSSVCTENQCFLHSLLNKPIVTERKGRISASEIR